MNPNDANEILTPTEAAHELRCSKAHVYKAIRGEIKGVSRLPAISMGTRRLIRRCSLERWKQENETVSRSRNDKLPPIA